MQPENPPPPNYPGYPPPPVNGPGYAPPPPRPGTPVWVWVLVGCLGAGGCVILPILAAILFPVFAQARAKAREVSCLSNVKIIGLGTLMYVQDYDERYPMASSWQTGISPYIKNDQAFHCPAAVFTTEPPGSGATTYAFDSVLDMMKLKRLAEPANTIAIYDSTDYSQNAHDALTSLPSPGRHIGRNNIGFTDGHAKSWPDSEPLPKGEILPDTP